MHPVNCVRALKRARLTGWINFCPSAMGTVLRTSVLCPHKKSFGGVECRAGRDYASVAPAAREASLSEILRLQDFILRSDNLLVITGAGVSTECGIPDYRSPNGAYSLGYKPITHQEFMASEACRRRYWARSYVAWAKFSSTRPGPSHDVLARWQGNGHVGPIITQNVDRLHQSAGAKRVLEIHGTTHEVICTECHDRTTRESLQKRLDAINPQWAGAVAAAASMPTTASGSLATQAMRDALERDIGLTPPKEPSHQHPHGAASGVSNVSIPGPSQRQQQLLRQRPDGDVEIGPEHSPSTFVTARCLACGADALKPDVVFFGANVHPWVADESRRMVEEADSMLILGSSMATMSCFRLAKSLPSCMPRATLTYQLFPVCDAE
eukprot:jgi/Mesvir1/22499/Mv18532-RA.1